MPGCHSNYGALNPGPWDCDPNPWAYTMVQPPQCNNESGYNCTFVFGTTIGTKTGQIIATGSSSRVCPVLCGTPTITPSTTVPGTNILRMEFDTCCVPCSPVCRVNVTAVERSGNPNAYMTSESVFCQRVAVELNVGAWVIPTGTAQFPLEIYVEFVSQ